MTAAAATTSTLAGSLQHRRWWFSTVPFPHYRARDVFTRACYTALEREVVRLVARGLSDRNDDSRLSRNMPNSDAYAWNLPPDLDGPLSLFYCRPWHQLLAGLFDLELTSDVNAAVHHHHPGSADGRVHRDLGVGWFSDQPRRDGVNPMDLARCTYTHGRTAHPDIRARETVRAITAIYYLANPAWQPGQGGETGLYRAERDPVAQPVGVVPPVDNSLLVFENTPRSYHSFLRNPRLARNSIIVWLHRPRASASVQWGEGAISTW